MYLCTVTSSSSPTTTASSLPVLHHRLDLTYKSTSSDAEALKHSIEASQARYAQTPGLAVETTLSGRELTVKIKTTPRETAEYFLGAYIVEDDIYTEQSGADDG